MNFFEIFKKWNGKFVDVDNACGPQCMDWMHQFVSDYYGLDRSYLAAPTAKKVWYGWMAIKGNDKFVQIPNRPWNVPKQGDIIFWNYGDAGHVAIVNEAGLFKLTSIDQNFPLNTAVHVQEHTYNGCLGWLRKK